jgi:hypothetical protein
MRLCWMPKEARSIGMSGEKVLEADYFKGALQKVEARRPHRRLLARRKVVRPKGNARLKSRISICGRDDNQSGVIELLDSCGPLDRGARQYFGNVFGLGPGANSLAALDQSLFTELFTVDVQGVCQAVAKDNESGSRRQTEFLRQIFRTPEHSDWEPI